MWQFLMPFVSWLGSTPFAHWVGASTDRIAWLFIFHLFGLVLLLGSMIFVSLRLLNLTLRQRALEQVARAAFPFTSAGLLLMVVSGATIFSGGAVAYFDEAWF